MCESSIIKKKNGEEIVLAEDIDFIKVISKGKLLIRTVLGEERYIDGDIKEIDLHRHRVVIKDK